VGPAQLDDRRPFAQANWIESLQGGEAREIYEVALHSDARLSSELADGFGPYKVFNLVADRPLFGSSGPIAALRIENFLENLNHESEETDTAAYHGATFWEEIASLLSLSLGVRLRAGGVIRDFRHDPRGHPRAELRMDVPVLIVREGRPLIPALQEPRHWDQALELLNLYPAVPGEEAVRLVRAARNYQNALWIAETDPTLAWLLLVSAAESPVARHQRGPTERFVEFLAGHAPPPPEGRPSEIAQVNWSREGLKAALRKVYRYRSSALHEGVPFPWPMCAPPTLLDGTAPSERFPAISAHGYGGSWMAKDLPMYLHVFEYIARCALQKWWREIARQGPRVTERA
jgi:hypothetical protein